MRAQTGNDCGSSESPSLEAEIFELLSQHSMTNRQLAEWEYFENEQAAGRWIRRRRQKGLIFWNGATVQFNGRKPEKLWSRGWIPKKNEGLHNHLLTDVCLTLNADRIERQQIDKKRLPDAEAWWDGQVDKDGTYDEHWFIEVSTGPGSMTVKEIAETRFPTYRDATDPVLWVCHGATKHDAEQWAKWLTRRALATFWFTTTYRLIDEGDLTATDRDGSELTLPER